MLKPLQRYLKQTDWIYLFLCIACSAMSVTVLLSYSIYERGGNLRDV